MRFAQPLRENLPDVPTEARQQAKGGTDTHQSRETINIE